MRIYSIAIMAVLILVLSGCSNIASKAPALTSQPLPTVPSDYAGKTIPSDVDGNAGAGVFKTDCATCHGEGGRGDGPASQTLEPPPANLVDLSKIAGDDFLFWKINTGVEGTAMPAWKGILTDQQIWQVIAFIRKLK